MARQPAAPAHACAFDLALLAGCAVCRRAGQTHVGERIVVGCFDRDSSERCRAVLEKLRENADFVFRRRDARAVPTHAESLRLRCGGLTGLAAQLNEGGSAGETIDVDALAAQLGRLPEGLDAIAWDRVVREIASCRVPRRRRRR